MASGSLPSASIASPSARAAAATTGIKLHGFAGHRRGLLTFARQHHGAGQKETRQQTAAVLLHQGSKGGQRFGRPPFGNQILRCSQRIAIIMTQVCICRC